MSTIVRFRLHVFNSVMNTPMRGSLLVLDDSQNELVEVHLESGWWLGVNGAFGIHDSFRGIMESDDCDPRKVARALESGVFGDRVANHLAVKGGQDTAIQKAVALLTTRDNVIAWVDRQAAAVEVLAGCGPMDDEWRGSECECPTWIEANEVYDGNQERGWLWSWEWQREREKARESARKAGGAA